MAKQINVFIKNTGETLEVEGGITVEELYNQVKDNLKLEPICALVNNQTEDLCFPLYGPKQVEFIDHTTAAGRRVYIRSLCMILYKAINDLYPGERLVVEHSIGGGYFCSFKHAHEKVENGTVDALKARMKEIVVENAPFVRCERLTTEVVELFKQQGLNDKVRLLSESKSLYTVYYQLGDIIDYFYGPLAPNTGYIKVFDLVPYKDGMLLLGPDLTNNAVAAKAEPHDKLFKAFEEYRDFNDVVRIADVGLLNAATKNKYVSLLINVAEALHAQKFSQIADQIAERFKQGGAKVILLAGPSSSGKTTSSKRLAIQLVTKLIRPKVISLDNYFVDRSRTPRDESGDYDYESLYALDLDQFNKDITDLIAGKEVAMPTYNFETGEREYRGDTIKLEPDEVLLMEGIHGLNPELTKLIPEEQKFRVYVSALTTLNIDDHNWISTSDNRLLRRIVRDYKYRGASAQSTIARWPSVRRGEEQWIFPYQENADAMFNSSLIFELAVMKNYAIPVLEQVPHNAPEYVEASRLLRFLQYFDPINEKDVPNTSLLREFLGGSSFHY